MTKQKGKKQGLVIKKIRQGVADLIRSAGCSCCRDDEGWESSKKLLAYILRVPKYKDGSGYDFNKFRSGRP